jgi:hypothetical protein
MRRQGLEASLAVSTACFIGIRRLNKRGHNAEIGTSARIVGVTGRHKLHFACATR